MKGRLAHLLMAAITAATLVVPATAKPFDIKSRTGATLQATSVAVFGPPWAMTFLPDGTMLVTSKRGKLYHVTQDGEKTEVEGMWEVAFGGQGGLGDIVLHPQFSSNGFVYISYAESALSGFKRGAAVSRARLDTSGNTPKLTDVEKIWAQTPKTSGRGHYSHRIAFGPDGMLYITSGDRQKLDPAQDFGSALGKIIRLHDDGKVPADNPWQDKGDLAKTFWSMGHRNLLGIHFDADGRLWTHEMGPRHGDELNLIVKGDNYGWPIVSQGDHYSGDPIPNHETRSEFNPPEAFWVPTIAPSGLVIYSGKMFENWRGDAFIGGLRSRALIRVELEGETAREADRFEWQQRVREVEEGPAGALWVLEDGAKGRLLKLQPKT